ncbi:hypothetical protein ACFYW1_16350 [Streptomyces sp. NPDC002669]|uniref:hypothetical protein n=1 Tax=Streptomyces sp. NPDC002669 TaxID=3364658 RepID=UPI003678DE45
MDDIADQGGEGGRLAAALRDELNTAKAEPCATLELDLDAIRAMYPPKPIDDGSDVYVPLPHRVHWRSTDERCLVPVTEVAGGGAPFLVCPDLLSGLLLDRGG